MLAKGAHIGIVAGFIYMGMEKNSMDSLACKFAIIASSFQVLLKQIKNKKIKCVPKKNFFSKRYFLARIKDN